MQPLFSRTRRTNTRSKRSKRLSLLGLTAGLLTLGVLSAQSVILPFDANVPLAGATVVLFPKLAGGVLHDPLIPFTIKNSHGVVVAFGRFQDRVVRETSTGTLDFYYRVILDPNSPLPVTAVSRFNYPHFALLDVNYRLDGLGVDAPDTAFRNGNEVTFQFTNTPIQPGKDSRFVYISTEYKNFWLGGSTVLQTPDGSGTVLTTAAPQ